MNEILFDLGLSALFTTLKKAKTSVKLKRQMKNVFLKIAKKIFEVYGDDEEFANVINGD